MWLYIIIVSVIMLNILLVLYLSNEYKNNRIERTKLAIGLLKDSLLLIIIYFVISIQNNTNTITNKLNAISNKQSIMDSIKTAIDEINNKSIIFVEDITSKVDSISNNLDKANQQIEDNIKQQQIINIKLEQIKQQINEANTIQNINDKTPIIIRGK